VRTPIYYFTFDRHTLELTYWARSKATKNSDIPMSRCTGGTFRVWQKGATQTQAQQVAEQRVMNYLRGVRGGKDFDEIPELGAA